MFCIAAGNGAECRGIFCVAVGDACRSIGGYQVVVGDTLTLPANYTSGMYQQFLVQVRNNIEVYDAVCEQGYAPKDFAEKARKALLPLVARIEEVIKVLQVEEAKTEAEAPEKKADS
jgi:hypothetical protein